MNLQKTDLKALMNSDHPARTYILVGGAAIALGIIRGRISGLALMAAGGMVLSQALKEIQKTNRLHGGNFHGQNGKPNPRLEDKIAIL